MELIPMAMLLVVLLVREWTYHREREQNATEREMLLQRVQAPREIAYKEFQESLPPGAPSEPIWTDEDAWAALNSRLPKATE